MGVLSRVRRSLFLRFYLTVLGSLMLLALGTGMALMLLTDRDERGWHGRQQAFVAAVLGEPGRDPAAARIVLDRLAVALDAEIIVRGRGGRVLATAAPPGRPVPEARHGRRDRHAVTVDLADGRTVTARFRKPPPHAVLGTVLFALALLVVAIGLAAWPATRGLTRRLERLRSGVTAWGAGDLSTRVRLTGEDEVAAVAGAFDEAAARIERMMAANRHLLAHASHELRSPLARLRMALDLAERDMPPERRAGIEADLAELDALVGEILLASRLDHGGVRDAAEPVDLLALAAEEAAREGLPDGTVGGEPVELRGDPALLARAIRNLLVNARRHGAPPVEVGVRREGGEAALSVRDHGPGIPEADRARVFEPFWRPAGAGETGSGWGLGLSLVRQIAQGHGGRVEVAAAPGGGALFTMRLPLVSPGGRA